MILLDTNIVSEFAKMRIDDGVAAWKRTNSAAGFHLCDVVIMELSYGAERFFRKTGSRRYHESLAAILVLFDGKIFGLRQADALLAGELRARRDAMGRPICAGRHDRRHLPRSRRNPCHPQHKRFRRA